MISKMLLALTAATLAAFSVTACTSNPTAPTPPRWEVRTDPCHEPATYFYPEPTSQAQADSAQAWYSAQVAAGRPPVVRLVSCTPPPAP